MSFYRQLNIIGNNLSFAPVLHCQFAAATGSDYLPLHQPQISETYYVLRHYSHYNMFLYLGQSLKDLVSISQSEQFLQLWLLFFDNFREIKKFRKSNTFHTFCSIH